MQRFTFLLLIIFGCGLIYGQETEQLDSIMPVRGFCIAAPQPDRLDDFIEFMENDLAEGRINTLILRVDYNYQYKSYPNLANDTALSETQIKRLVKTARENNMRLIPQINLLGHQSWANDLGNLLEEYPEFDETPHIEMPEEYEWPNEDGLYCKSYCPRHPEVHEVVFALVDEIMEVFETDAFHAGMDEVFYIGDDKCPRCKGADKAVLFAEEVERIRDHLARNDGELWIWGDRLLDGRTTGLGMWEASMNNTHRAIDMIPRDVVICDWHYVRAEPTAAYFAMKGLKVVSCPWRMSEVALAQVEQTLLFREHANPKIRKNVAGMVQTIWTGAGNFLDLYYGDIEGDERQMGQVESSKALFSRFRALEKSLE